MFDWLRKLFVSDTKPVTPIVEVPSPMPETPMVTKVDPQENSKTEVKTAPKVVKKETTVKKAQNSAPKKPLKSTKTNSKPRGRPPVNNNGK